MSEPLTQGQTKFAGVFARETGLNARVVGSWLKAEQSGSAAEYYEGKNYNNWLNIAQTDSGPAGGAHSSVWSNPETAAKASAEWIKGKGKIAQEYGAPAEGVRNILHSAGQGPEEQIKAISGSGWASSGYDGGNTLRELYKELSGHQLALVSAVQRTANNKAGIAPIVPEATNPLTAPKEAPKESNPIDALTAINTGMADPIGGTTADTIEKNWQALKALYEPAATTSTTEPIHQPATGEAPAMRLPGEEETDAERTLKYATQHIGKFAESGGANLGPELNKLEQQFGMTGEPWCAIFATTAISQGGASTATRTASVAEINQWASEGTHGYQKGLKPSSSARAGDLLTFGNEHVALVKSVKDGVITTIEGNADGSGGVVQLTHKVGEGQIARPVYGGNK